MKVIRKKIPFGLSFLSLFILGACAPSFIPRQYQPYYNEKGDLLAQPEKHCRELRLPFNIGEEILPSYLHNNLVRFSATDTFGIDETWGIFKFRIAAQGKVESIEMIEGTMPDHAKKNLIQQLQQMRFTESKHRTTWYLPLYLEIAYGKEVHRNGYVFEGKPGFVVWQCFNPRDIGTKHKFQAH